MSGPKYSEAELRRMEEERLEAERKRKLEEMRKILEEARGRLIKEFDNLNEIKNEIKSLEKQISQIDDFYFVDQIHRLLVDISEIKYDVSGDKEIIEQRIIQIKEITENFKKQIRELIYKKDENMYVKQIQTVECEEEKTSSNILLSKERSYDKYYELLDECESLYAITAEDSTVIENISNRLALLLENEEDLLEIEKIYSILKGKVYDSIKKQEWRLKLYDDYVIKAITLNENIRDLAEFPSLEHLKIEIERLDVEIKENGTVGSCAMSFFEQDRLSIADLVAEFDKNNSFETEKKRQTILADEECMKCDSIFLCGGTNKLPCIKALAPDLCTKKKFGINLELFVKRYLKCQEDGTSDLFVVFEDGEAYR